MILRYIEFINELSGTELVGPVGPAYGDINPKNNTINTSHTDIIYSDIDGSFYSESDFQELRNKYIINFGKKQMIEFNSENIDEMLNYLKQKKTN